MYLCGREGFSKSVEGPVHFYWSHRGSFPTRTHALRFPICNIWQQYKGIKYKGITVRTNRPENSAAVI